MKLLTVTEINELTQEERHELLEQWKAEIEAWAPKEPVNES